MTITPASIQLPESVKLAPNYIIPIVIVVAAVPIALVQIWFGLGIGVFGLFLAIQASIIKLEFTTTTLNVYRSNTIIRTFPYSEWENWVIFWQPVPILFYFKEVNSIHFLPVIFDAKMLLTCLEYYRPQPDLD
jgi:hypothetical protein